MMLFVKNVQQPPFLWYNYCMTNEKNFSSELSWKPDMSMVSIPAFSNIVLCGMGGSHLGAGVIKVLKPGVDIYVHRSYGLPPFSEAFLKQALCVASSYSGNTEEVLSFYDGARAHNLPLLVIASGGKLLKKAQEDGVPVVLLPQGFPPRNALGFFVKALSYVLGDAELVLNLEKINFDRNHIQEEASGIAQKLENKIPLIYSSVSNLPLAYIWKIKLNETAKIPAFYNCLPEVNHNEMEGFERQGNTAPLSEQFACLLIEDVDDHPRIKERMNVLATLYREKGLLVEKIILNGSSKVENVVRCVELIDAVSQNLATLYGVDPDSTPMIESFKKQLS